MGNGNFSENQLCDIAREDYGYAEIRSPGSGTKDVAYPDVALVKAKYERDYGVYEKKISTKVVAVELKNNNDGTAWFDKHEIEELNEWADRAGADAYAGLKPDLRSYNQWFFIPTDELHKTDKGFSIRKADHERALSIDGILG